MELSFLHVNIQTFWIADNSDGSSFNPQKEIVEAAKNGDVQMFNSAWDEEGVFFYQVFFHFLTLFLARVGKFFPQHQAFPCFSEGLGLGSPRFLTLLLDAKVSTWLCQTFVCFCIFQKISKNKNLVTKIGLSKVL